MGGINYSLNFASLYTQQPGKFRALSIFLRPIPHTSQLTLARSYCSNYFTFVRR